MAHHHSRARRSQSNKMNRRLSMLTYVYWQLLTTVNTLSCFGFMIILPFRKQAFTGSWAHNTIVCQVQLSNLHLINSNITFFSKFTCKHGCVNWNITICQYYHSFIWTVSCELSPKQNLWSPTLAADLGWMCRLFCDQITFLWSKVCCNSPYTCSLLEYNQFDVYIQM